MIEAMPRPRPPHLSREITRHGRAVWYVRIGKPRIRIRIRAEFGTPEFDAEYQAAISGSKHLQKKPTAGSPGTLAWLIARYRETSAWAELSTATRRQRDNIFQQILESAGDQPLSKITRSTIIAGRERRAQKHLSKRVTFSTPCAGCSAGRSTLAW